MVSPRERDEVSSNRQAGKIEIGSLPALNEKAGPPLRPASYPVPTRIKGQCGRRTIGEENGETIRPALQRRRDGVCN